MVKIAASRYEVSSFEELASDIRDANITPGDDVITIKNSITLLSRLPNITSNISFLGNLNSNNPSELVTLDGGGTQNSIFSIPRGEVSFSNLRFQNGVDKGEDTSPDFSLGFVGFDGRGGALEILGGNVIVNNVEFVNNVAQGGSILQDGSVSLLNSRAGNGLGGAVYVGRDGSFTVSNSLFSQNKAIGGDYPLESSISLGNRSGVGGAIFVDVETGGKLNFIDKQSVKFQENTTNDRFTGERQEDIYYPLESTSIERRPVLIVPGIIGSFYNDSSSFQEWNLNRGLAPEKLQLDPIARTYDDLVATLENAGYKLNEDLFTVPYDWRLELAPTDSNEDGNLTGLSAANLVDDTFEYGVDYLGVALKQAADKWRERFPNGPALDAVDVVAHSMGGLVTRSYIQSDAYGTSVGVNGTKLPTVNNLIMLGTPNGGAPKAWNTINDDWNADDFLFRNALRPLVNTPYQKVLDGTVIEDTSDSSTIDLTTINSANIADSKKAFIEQYSPSLRALLPTAEYGFGIQIPEDKQNKLLQDLNANKDATASRSKVTIIYGLDLDTITGVNEITGPKKIGESPITNLRGDIIGVEDVYDKSLASFTDVFSRAPVNGEIWWDETLEPLGDGTVPVKSAIFINAQNTLPLSNVEHTDLPSNTDAQAKVLEILNADPISPSTELKRGTFRAGGSAIAHFISDPVDGFLADAQGRRLGYSQATGPVTEIPNSVWFGNNDGIGWIFGDESSIPTSLQLVGLGDGYYVQISGLRDGQEFGTEASGDFLAQGELRNLDIKFGTTSGGTGNDILASAGDSFISNERFNDTYTYDGSNTLNF